MSKYKRTGEQDLALGQVPPIDYYAVHWDVSLQDAQREFEARGYRVHDIAYVERNINANDARNYVFNAWKDGKCSHWDFRGNYSVGNATVYSFMGEYAAEPNNLDGTNMAGYGEDP